MHANSEHVWHYKRALATQNEWGSDLWDESWDVLDEDDDWYQRMGCWGYPYDAKLPFTSLFGEGDGMGEGFDAASEPGQARRLAEGEGGQSLLKGAVEELSAKKHHDRIRDELIELAAGGRSGYTNRELHQKFHPWNPTLPFMYETFSWVSLGSNPKRPPITTHPPPSYVPTTLASPSPHQHRPPPQEHCGEMGG